MNLPNRGETYRGPDGSPVQVEAVDGAIEGVILVKPIGAGSTVEPTRVPLRDFREGYVLAHQGATVSTELLRQEARGTEEAIKPHGSGRSA